MTVLPKTEFPYRLRLPGPTAIPEAVRMAGSRPIINHRGAEMRVMLGEVQQMLRPLFGTAQPVVLQSSSGTGAMEAALVNVLAPGEKVLACVNGQFSERFAKIAAAHGAGVDVLDIEWGKAPDPEAVRQRLAGGDYRAVLVVHNESSTGALADLRALGAVTAETPSLLVVDSVSGIGGAEMRQDDWGVDVIATGSQKALMCPPGLGLISVSAKARAVVERDDRCARFYWDLRKALPVVDQNETAFTGAVSLAQSLHTALSLMHEEGIEEVYARHLRLSKAMRAGFVALGLEAFGDPAAYSPTVVVGGLPATVNGGDVVRHMLETYNTAIAGARNKLQGRVIRIGTMGAFSIGDVMTDLLYLGRSLQALGHSCDPDAAVAAALSANR
ncbi:alanine--glyoxylate aminotransferase family protein [Aquamicrobium lusatiense]|uniref:pyridoxal-phosphate-dependent aminotransferase family protein n=1 Tax=Aquamicrobium lusatiense TaxID=89772 RepID=UPI0024554E74|nr:alanine--glyoxylate aminotransferase family protein [Aquamicrobium lusatiense]MDH4989658.1 alanine--glyoxylate aminotransferase family protein [Aquamicrobium lusatiense]